MKRIYKFLIIISIFVCCLLFSGSTVIHASEDGSSRYGYSQLTEAEKTLYDNIAYEVEGLAGSSVFCGDLSSLDKAISVSADSLGLAACNRVFQTFFFDNPQYYWLSSNSRAESRFSETTLTIYVDNSYLTLASRTAVNDAISDTLDEWLPILNEIKNTETADDSNIYLTGLKLHDLIIDRIDYAYEGSRPSTARSAHSIAGVFTGSGAVCEGYARAYQYILNLLDIDNVYLTGQSRGEGHAWNCIKLDCEYYCVDTTWDDGNDNSYLASYDGRIYDYFCSPISTFRKDHTNDSSVYRAPAFSDSSKYVYYNYFGSRAESELSPESADALISSACSKCYGDYIYYVVPTQSSLRTLVSRLGVTGSFSSLRSPFGLLYIKENININNPAVLIELDTSEEEIALENDETKLIHAILQAWDAECDDRVIWTVSNPDVVSISVKGTECTIRGKRDGTATLTATAMKGKDEDGAPLSASVSIKVGTGIFTPLYTLWAGGDKNHKTLILEHSITASSYHDEKGKVKAGKLVWVVLDSKSDISFDTEKHKVLTKSSKGTAMVSSSGKVTAKKPGTAYVYCIDTGSMTWECFDIEILQAPLKLLISNTEGSTDKENLLKNVAISVGHTGTAYIIPTAKEGECSETGSYTITYAKSSDSKYLDFTAPETDEEGNIYFTITGLLHDSAKNKPASVKLNIENTESGKKTTLNVKVTNSITGFSPSFSSTKLEKKKDTVTIKLNPETDVDNAITTDRLKFYAAEDITLNGKKISTSGKSKIRLKYDKHACTLTLTASADITTPSKIAVAATDSATGITTLWYICEIDSTGNINAGCE